MTRVSTTEGITAGSPDKRADSDGDNNGEISFAELFSALSARWRIIVWAVSITGFVATAIAFLIPAEYTAEAVILTPQQAQSSLSAMAQLAGAGIRCGVIGAEPAHWLWSP